jgi:hypothetical protein
MKPTGNALTSTVCRRENAHFKKPLSNGKPVPKLLNIFGWWFAVTMERWLLLMLQTCPNHLSKSPCKLRFWKLLLPECYAQCVLIQTGTPDSHVRFGQKGCISKTVVAEKDAFIRDPLRGLYEVSLYGLSRSSPWASEAGLPHLSWHLLWKEWAAKTWEYLSYWFFLPTELRLGRPFGNWTGTPFTTYCTCIIFHSFALLLFM